MGRAEAPVLYRPVGLRVTAERSVFTISADKEPVDYMIFTDKNERALEMIESEVLRRSVTIVEPHPLQLWGDGDGGSQSVGFQAGFDFINKLEKKDRAKKIKYYALEDDVSDAPLGVKESEIEGKRDMLYSSSAPIQESPFANPKRVGVGRYRRFTQSALARSAGSTACSKVDAEFNYNKIVDQITSSGRGGKIPDVHMLGRLLLVVVHPNERWMMEQQLVMVQALFEKMRSRPIFQKLDRTKTYGLIAQMFRHVWVDKNGMVVAVSHPVKRSDSWVHEKIFL